MFTKDNRTEVFLTQMGVDWSYTNRVVFGDLVPAWNKHNLARPVPVRDDAVLEYGALMDSGSPAPATILSVTDRGYDVLDGVQRLSAAEMIGCTSFPAYVVKCDSENVLTSIRVLANARLQGRPEPIEWTRKRAVDVLVLQKGMSAAEVARLGGWKKADVEATARRMDWGFQIRCIGGPQSMPDSFIDALAKHTTKDDLAKSPKQMAGFLNTVKKSQFSTKDVEPYLAEFFAPITKKTKRDQVYADRLEEFQGEPEVAIRVNGRRGPRLAADINFKRTLESALTVATKIVDEETEVLNVDQFFRILKKIDAQVRKMSSNTPPPDSPRVPADKWS